MTDLVLVSYLNTIPFLKGLTSPQGKTLFNLHKRTPNECADMFGSGEASIALVPVGSLPYLPSYEVISDYCIGCIGEVKTVVLLSQEPLDKVNTIYLDMDSRSSRLLTKILLGDYLNQKVEYINGVPSSPLSMKANEATLMIGDKVFYYEDKFTYKYDLGELWMKETGLPFAFAVWVADPTVDKETVSILNELLSAGVENLDHTHFENEKGIDLDTYFTKHISYRLDNLKKDAIEKYLALGQKYLEKL